MTEKEKVKQIEKALAVCQKTVRELAKEISALKQDVFLLKEEDIDE